MAVMTYRQIQDAVMWKGSAEFERPDVQNWIVDAHTEIWDAADYVFKSVLAAATVVSGVLTGPTDIGDVYAVYDGNGDPLAPYYDVARFYDRYNSTVSLPGSQAEAFLALGNAIVVAPATAGTMTGFQVAYRKLKPTLTNDADLSGLPDGYDMALVYGAKAIGFTLINNPFADDFRQYFMAKKQQLKDAYTYGIDEAGLQTPAYRPGV